MGKVKGKVALVTGAGSGIGRATALLFAQEGAKVVVVDIVPEGGKETVNMIKKAGGEALFVQVDISRADQVQAMIKKAVDTYGRLDCAANNAGIEAQPAPTADCTEADFDRTVAVNLKGTFLCMKYEIQQMLKQGGGTIVNTSSMAGMVGVAGMPAYTAAKHGIVGLTRTAALEYGTAGIRVNAVCPGATRTPMVQQIITAMPELGKGMEANHPIGRIGEPNEIAEAIVWLCSDESSFVTGHPMAVDGGLLAK
ncbi:MAG: SDR family oxidoreductase [Chloroflexi bacterium]|nr:SDR family oxidoreductase [Chloroflexota bacterium]